jgi:hypothetical protein
MTLLFWRHAHKFDTDDEPTGPAASAWAIRRNGNRFSTVSAVSRQPIPGPGRMPLWSGAKVQRRLSPFRRAA